MSTQRDPKSQIAIVMALMRIVENILRKHKEWGWRQTFVTTVQAILALLAYEYITYKLGDVTQVNPLSYVDSIKQVIT